MAGNEQDVKHRYLNYLNSEQGARQYNRFKEIVYGTPDSLVVHLSRVVSPLADSSDRILDVGGADGKRLVALLDYLPENIDATLVEPSAAFIRNVPPNIDAIHSTFEEATPKGKYDLALLIHSIFTFKDASYIEKLSSLLSPKGHIVIASNAETSFLAGLKKIVDSRFSTTRREITNVYSDLEEHGFSYQTYRFGTQFKGATNNQRLTAEGRDILEWIALTPYDGISDDTMTRATEYFLEHTQNGIITEDEIVVVAKRDKPVTS